MCNDDETHVCTQYDAGKYTRRPVIYTRVHPGNVARLDISKYPTRTDVYQ